MSAPALNAPVSLDPEGGPAHSCAQMCMREDCNMPSLAVRALSFDTHDACEYRPRHTHSSCLARTHVRARSPKDNGAKSWFCRQYGVAASQTSTAAKQQSSRVTFSIMMCNRAGVSLGFFAVVVRNPNNKARHAARARTHTRKRASAHARRACKHAHMRTHACQRAKRRGQGHLIMEGSISRRTVWSPDGTIDTGCTSGTLLTDTWRPATWTR